MRILILFISLLACQFSLALIPTKDFAKHTKYTNAVISPTGDYLAVTMRTEKGGAALAVLDLKNNKWTANIGFQKKVEPYRVVWVNDERILVQRARAYFGMNQPIPNGALFAVNYDGSKQKHLVEIQSSVTSGYEYANHLKGFARPLHFLPDDPSHIIIHFYPWTRKKSDNRTELYKLNVYNGNVRRIAESPTNYSWFLTDDKGKPTYTTGYRTYDIRTFHKYENGKWVKIREQDESKEGERWINIQSVYNTDDLIVEVEKAGGTNFYIRYNVKTGESKKIYQHKHVDPTRMIYDYDTNEPVAVRTDHHYPELHVLNTEHEAAKWYPTLKKAFDGQFVNVTGFTDDVGTLSLVSYSDRNPRSMYLFDTKTKQFKKIFDSAPWLKSADLSETLPFDFKNRDGDVLSGYFTAPNNGKQKHPLIVVPHGGPHYRDFWGYDPDTQFLASRGYAVLKVNFRGSTGFGIDFMNAGNKRWGDKIQNDIIDATKWIIDQGVIEKERICIYGASFGGYSALMAPTLEPDLYKCAVGYVGVYDLNLMWSKGDIQDWHWGENALMKLIGDDKEHLDTHSPINHIDKLKAPVFLVHGKKDQRAHFAHYKVMLAALKKAGHPVETMVAKNEGHGFYSEKNREKLYNKLDKFFEKHIGL